MSISSHHTEWLSLLEISGPFLTLPVLMRVWPQGIDALESERTRLRRELEYRNTLSLHS